MKTPISLYSRLALITSVTLVIGYFVVYAWTTINPVNNGDILTSSLINNMIGNLTDLNDRVLNFTFSSGNVGIGVSPAAKLQVNGNTYTNQVCNQSGGNCLDFSNKMPGSIYFRAYRSTNQSISPAIYTTILFNTESVDNSNSYNPTTGIFTVPVSGFYHFDGNIEFDNTNAGQVDIKIYSPQKGTLCYEAQDAATATISDDRMGCSGSTYFDAGDTIYTQAYQNTGASVYLIANDTVFSGFLVSQ